MARKSAKSATVGNPTLPAQYSAFGSVSKPSPDVPDSSDSRIRRRYGRRVAKGQVSVDPAMLTKDAAPNLGRDFLPQIITFSGMQSTVSHVYRNPDEAIRHSLENARFMRNDCSIMESLEARQRGTALLNYHLEPEDAKDPKQKELVTDLQAILEEIERFTEYRRNLLEAIWYGRTAIKNLWERRVVRGKPRFCIRGWLPVNGDKLAFRYDDGSGKYPPNQIGIRVGGASSQKDSIAGDRQIEVGDFGQCYFLEPWERSLLTVHKHMIEDGAFEDPISAGRVHGVGVRDRIYWCWFQKQETMAQLMEVIERTGTGFTIYYYQYGNAEDKAEMLDVAQRQAPSNVILMPRMSEDPSMNANGIERIEPSTAGITAMREIIGEFFGWQIKRYILGQTLSSEASATGLGSGVADLHQDTFLQIIQYDAVNLEETITSEVVEHLKNYNFPWARDLKIKFKIDTKENESEKKLSGFKQAWDMGCRLKASDVMDVIGASMPDEDDEVLQNPEMQQQQRLWEQAHPQAGDIGQAGGVVGEDGQESQEGSVEDQFGPIAGLLGGGDDGAGGQAGGGNGSPGGPGSGGGGGMPGGGGVPSGPMQYAKQQVKSSPGQTKLFDHDTSRATSHKWREELHPRDHGKFAEKGAGHVSSAVAGPGGVRAKQAASSPGQKLLGLAGDAAEQIGMGKGGAGLLPTLPAQKGPGDEQPFSLSGKPVKGKSLFPGSGKTKQVDLFAGRGDAPGQMSFGDDVDPASKKVGEQGEIAAPKHIGPGDTVTIPASNTFGQFEAEITDEGEGRVGIRQKSSTDARPIAKMHRNQLPQFLDDLNGVIHGKPDSASESINHVLAGKGKFLGRGNDGLAFDAGNGQVVKASSDIPFHWNNGLRDNHEGRNILQNQVKQNEHLRAAGVPGLLPQELHEHGGRTFVTMPKVDTEAKLTPEHVQQLRNTLNKMHDAGYALKDLVQVGIDHEGNARIFDTGAVKKLDKNPTYAKDDMKTDEGNLNYLIKKHGHDEVSLNYERDYHDRAGHTEVYLSRLENNPDKPANLEYLKSHRDSLAKAWEGVDDDTKEFLGEEHDETLKRLDAQIAKHSPEGKLQPSKSKENAPADRPSLVAPSGPAPGDNSGGAPSAEQVKDTTPKAAPSPAADDPHLSRARAILARIPKVTAHGLSVQTNGEITEEHAVEILAKLRGGGEAKPEPASEHPGGPPQRRGDYEWKKTKSGTHSAWFKDDKQITGGFADETYNGKPAADYAWEGSGLKDRDEPKPKSESATAADKALIEDMSKRYGHLSTKEIESKIGDMSAEIASLQHAGRREFNGNGGRRTSAAVSNEGARNVGKEKLRLGIYLQHRKENESLTPEDRAALPEHLKNVNPAFPSEVEKLKGMAAKADEKKPARTFQTAGEAAKAGKSYADWQGEAHNAFVNEEIDEDHPAWQAVQHGNAPSVQEFNDAKSLHGQHVEFYNYGNNKREHGKVTDVSDDGKTVIVTRDNGSTYKASASELAHLGATVEHRNGKGKESPAALEYLAPKLAAEQHANGENIAATMRRHGLDPIKNSKAREAIASERAKLVEAEKPQPKEPSEARAKAMEQQELSGAKPVDEAAALARKWKKNDDGTYTSPNGTIWKKAAKDGEISPVTGKPFVGGQLMPIHGKSKVEIPDGKGTGEGIDLTPGIGGEAKKKPEVAKKKGGGGRKVMNAAGQYVPLPPDHVSLESIMAGSPAKSDVLGDEALNYLGVTRKQADEFKEIFKSEPSIPSSILPEGFKKRGGDSSDWSPLKAWQEHKAKEAATAAAESAPQPSPALQSAIAAAHQQLHEAGLAEKPAEVSAEASAEVPTLPAPEPEPPPTEKPTAPFSLADVAAHHKSLRAGEANAAQLREWFDHYTGDQSKIRDELKSKSVAELKEMGASGTYAGSKKPDLINNLANKIAAQYHLGGSLMYQPTEESRIDALRRHVHAQTDEHVKQFVDKHNAEQAARKARVSGAVKAIENPETLEEFREREKYKSSANHPLTDEQQAKYDDLAARDRRAKEIAKKSNVAAFRPGTEATGQVGIVEGHHQKRNAPTYTVTVENRLGDNWDEALSRAKRMGGNYVNAVIAKRYGATAGFQFFDKKSAEDFAKVLGGESVDTSEQVEQRRIESIGNASERLAAMAESTHAAADAAMNADRKTNTSKQAEQAASADATARNQKALAETMERLSGAMKDGGAHHLEGIRHGSHVAELNSQLRRARWQRMSAEGASNLGYDKYEEFRNRSPENDDVKHADYPYPAIWSDQLQKHLSEFKDEPGLMKIAQRLGKTAAGESPFKKTAGKMTTNGGTFISPSELEHKELAPHLRMQGVKEGQGVRIHRSTDYKLEQVGKGHKEFHTADGGRSWGTTPEIAIAAALNRGHELDVADIPQPKLLKITDSSDIADLATAAKRLKRHSNRDLRRIGEELSGRIESYNRMRAMDIKSPGELRAALRDYLPLRTKPEGESKIKKLERELTGKKIEGFFPTPAPLVERMLDAADIQPGHSVLEPSAGKGDILDAIRERHPDANAAGIEPYSSLRDILEAKGHALVDRDFTEHGENYDRIVMNPPFERGQDAEHVQHAYERLKPGGRIVAIMSNGPFFRSDKKSEGFRNWLDSVDGSHEELPEGSFAGKDAFRQTGVNTRLVVIDKPKE